MTDIPSLPEGFTLDQPDPVNVPPLPEGFTLDGTGSPAGKEGSFIPEAGKGVAAGATNVVGTAMKGLASPLGYDPNEEQRVSDLQKELPTVVDMDDEQFSDFMKRAMDASRNGGVPRRMIANARLLRDGKITVDQLQNSVDLLPDQYLKDVPLYQAGEDVQDFAQEKFAPAEDYQGSWTRAITEGLGSTLPFLLTAPLGPTTGATLGTALGSATSAGEAIDMAVQAGATTDQIMEAVKKGAYPGLTEQIPIETLFDRIPLPVAGKFANAVGRVLAQAAEEGGQEAVQQVWQNLIAKYEYNPDQEIGEGVAQAAGIGAIVGGGLRVGTEATGAVFGKGKTAPEMQNQDEAGAEATPPPAQEAVERVTPAAPAVQPGAGSDAVSPPVASVSPAATAEERALLNAAGNADDMIDAMSREEIEAELMNARQAAIEPSQEQIDAAMAYDAAQRPNAAPESDMGQPVQPMPQVPQTGRNIPTQPMRQVPVTGTREAPATVTTPADVEQAGQQVNTEPTEGQKEAGNYRKAHLKVNGLDITIENPAGSERRGISPDGEQWRTLMPAAYGYVKRSTGADGDQVDVYVGNNPQSDRVFVVNQKDPKTGKFDEHKAMVGFNTINEAARTYYGGFSDGSGPSRMDGIVAMSTEDFKAWLKAARQDAPAQPMKQEPVTGPNIPPAEPVAIPPSKPIPETDAPKEVKPRQKIQRFTEEGFPALKSGAVRRPDSLAAFLTRAGGLQDQTGELAVMDAGSFRVPGAGPLVRKNGGLELDRAREAAEQAGYLSEGSTVRDLLDALDEDLRGNAVYSGEDQRPAAAYEAEQGQARSDEMEAEAEAVYDQLVEMGYPGERGDAFMQDIARRMVVDGEPVSLEEALLAAENKEFLDSLETTGYYDTLEETFDAADQNTRGRAETRETPGKTGKPGKGRGQESAPETGGETVAVGGEVRPGPAQEGSRKPDSERAGQGSQERQPEEVGFDAKAWDKERADRIKASKAEGNTHLDQIEPSVETMRGLVISYVHDPKEKGVVRSVANTGDVVVHWSDKYSADKNLADEKTEGRKTVWESWLSPSDLKDYVVAKPKATTETGADNKPQHIIPGAEQISDKELAERKSEGRKKSAAPQKEPGGLFSDAKDEQDLFEAKPAKSGAKPNSVSEPAKSDRIEDFGEVLEGARKMLWQDYAGKLKEDVDIEAEPLSKSFPAPNYAKLSEEGVPGETLALVALMRNEIPSKPRAGWKVARWAKQVETLRGFAEGMLTDGANVEEFKKRARLDPMLRSLADTAEAIKALDPSLLPKAAEWRVESGRYSMYKGVHYGYDNPKVIWTIKNKKQRRTAERYGFDANSATDDTREGIIAKAKKIISVLVQDKKATPERSKYTKVNLYRDRKSGEVYLGFKARSSVIRLKDGFENPKEARAYLADNKDAIQDQIDEIRRGPNERNAENRERMGRDWRDADITPEDFSDAFGFRGVQFGNYVEGKRRQADLNRAYDALMDLADAVGIPPRALSLNGELGLAFGARGKGGKNAAAAHYEPGNIVINLTKHGGPGSLAHEWLHGLDNYFGRMDGRGGEGYASSRKQSAGGMRPEVFKAWKGVQNAMTTGKFYSRSKEFDKARSKDYWSTTIEMAARSFERYIIDRLDASGIRNDYLANIDLTGGAYPTDAEMAGGIKDAYDNLFDAIEAEETPEGNTRLFSPAKRTSTEAFRKWFGNSKVVDENGEPLVVYHGTDRSIDEFAIGDGTGKYGEDQVAGVYLTPSRDAAEFFAGSPTRAKVVVAAYASIRNPYRSKNVGTAKKEVGAETGRELTDNLMAMGHDGVILEAGSSYKGGVVEEIIAFSPTQIKSVNNEGTWPATDPRILKAPSKLDAKTTSDIRNIVMRVGGIDPEIVERIDVPGGITRWGDDTLTEAAGVYDPTVDAITISMSSGDRDTAYHEAFHRLQRLFLTSKEEAVLANSTEQLRQIVALGSDYANMAPTMDQIELEAEAFAVWSRQMDQGNANGIRLHIAIRRAWARIRNMIERVGNYLRGRGYQSMEDIFGRAYSGEMADRASQDFGDARIDPEMDDTPMHAIKAFHGSPHEFDRFDMSKIGTGEGAQAYGHGLYFAESEGVARNYRDSLTLNSKGSQVETEVWNALKYAGSPERAKADIQWKLEDAKASGNTWEAKIFRDALNNFDDIAKNRPGRMYEVNISATPEDFLDWDKPLSEQPQKVRDALPQGGKTIQDAFDKAFQDAMGDPLNDSVKAVSVADADRVIAERLREAGIAGIKYLDQGSRDGKGGTYNYVVFDDSLIDIERRYSIAQRIPAGTKPKEVPKALVTGRLKKALLAGVRSFKNLEGGKDRQTMDDGETFSEIVHRKWVDYLHPVYMMQERTGAKLTELNDIYLNARLAEDTALSAIQTMHDTYVTPMVEKLKGKATIEDLHSYLYALHAPERNRVVGLRNPEDSDLYKAVTDPTAKGASGMSGNEARAVINDLKKNPEAFKAVRDAAVDVHQMLKASLKRDKAAGLISADTYDLLTNQWKLYVPLKGREGMDEEGNWRPRSTGFDVRGDEFKQALGRFSEADNIIANAIAQSEEQILRHEKNNVGKAALRFVNQVDPKGESIAQVYWAGEDGLGDITKSEDVYQRVMGADGKVTLRKKPNPFSQKDDVLAAKVGGKTYYIRFKDAKVGLALRKMNTAQLAGIVKLIRKVSVWQSIVNTRANPAFTPINIIRDVQTGSVHLLDEGYSAKEIAGVVGNIPKAWKAIWNLSRNPDAKGEWDKWAKEYFDNGGKITFHGYTSMEENLKRLQADVNAEVTGRGRAVKIAKGLWKFIEDLNDAGENGIRLAAYVAARKKHGMTPKEAAFMSRDLTVDFKKHGEWGPTANSFYVFFNAALQGNYNIARRMARSNKVKAAIGGFMFAGMMQHVWNSLFAGDDDDGENAYYSILRNEPYKVERQFMFFIPGTTDYVSFPLPYGFNAFYHLGVQGGAMASGVRKAPEGLLDSVRVAFDAFNPIGSGSLVNMISPTIGDPIVELWGNQNFFGGPIYPEAVPFDAAPPPNSSRHWSSTNPYAVGFAEFLNEWTGGNSIEPGAIDWYPDAIEHVFGFFTGGIGRFGGNILETGDRAVKGEFEPEKTPWLRSLYGQMDEDNQKTEYYRQRELALEADGYLKDYAGGHESDDYQAFLKNRAVELEAAPAFKQAEKQRRKLNKMRRAIEDAPNMSRAEREAALKEIEDTELVVMRAARQAYEQARRNHQ